MEKLNCHTNVISNLKMMLAELDKTGHALAAIKVAEALYILESESLIAKAKKGIGTSTADFSNYK